MDIKEYTGLAAGICTGVSMVPQFIKTLKEKNVEAISWFLLLVLFVGNGLWIVYGVFLKDLPIIATNSFSLLMDSAMLVLKILYRNRKD